MVLSYLGKYIWGFIISKIVEIQQLSKYILYCRSFIIIHFKENTLWSTIVGLDCSKIWNISIFE